MERGLSKIKIYRKSELPLKADVSGAQMWAVGLKKTMLTYFELEPNTKFPEHSHEAEQITMVLEGELTFAYDGKEVVLKPGDVIAIPSNAVHSAFTGEKSCRAVDAWSPVRKKFLNKSVFPILGRFLALPYMVLKALVTSRDDSGCFREIRSPLKSAFVILKYAQQY